MQKRQPHHLSARFVTASLWLVVLIMAGCSEKSGDMTHDLSGSTMGTTWSVRLVSEFDPVSIRTEIQSRLDELNSRLSTYIESSEVSQFSELDTTDWFAVSIDTFTILHEAIAIAELSNGAFDITVGPLVELWGFGASGPKVSPPSQDEIDALLAHTGYELLELRDQPMAVRKNRKGVRIDLSAIAKGYAVDEIAGILDASGFTSYMAEIGGEIRTRGNRADGEAWRIAIEFPIAGARTVQRILALSDRAVATSGDYRNFFEFGGKRYSHTLNPRSGWPVDHDLAAVSVISDNAMTADALATALLVTGLPEALELAEQNNIAALFTLRSEKNHREIYSTGFREHVQPDLP